MLATLRRFQYKIIRIPILGPAIRAFVRQVTRLQFKDSTSYWLNRYSQGRTSGSGSYDELAQYKAEILNRFVAEKHINAVIEFGCGDGNQLRFAEYPQYIGYDISPVALARCRELFTDDRTKSFREMKAYANEQADLTLSLDVIYHLIEDKVFEDYMHLLFDAAQRFVIIYSSNQSKQGDVIVAHVKHRHFTPWVEANQPAWTLMQHIPNRHAFADDPGSGSFADFYIYERALTPKE